MRAGALRDRITLQRVTQTANAIGRAGAEAWASLSATPVVWAAIEALAGGEQVTGGRIQADATHRIRLRYRGDLKPKDRAVIGTRTFNVLAVLEADRRRETHLLVRELVA